MLNILFHLVSVGVRADTLATRPGNHVNETTVVLHAFLSASADHLLLCFVLRNLRRLSLDFTSTSERTVDFSHLKLFLRERNVEKNVIRQERTAGGNPKKMDYAPTLLSSEKVSSKQ